MGKHHRFGHGLVLFELILAIGFFTVFAAVCLRVFFAARTMAAESSARNHAVTAAENAAECFKAGEEPVLFYGPDWAPADRTDAAFSLTMETAQGHGVKTALITVSETGGGVLFALNVKTPEELAP